MSEEFTKFKEKMALIKEEADVSVKEIKKKVDTHNKNKLKEDFKIV